MDVLERQLTAGLLAHHPAMPKFRFTAREVSDLTAYITAIQGHELRPSPLSGPGGGAPP